MKYLSNAVVYTQAEKQRKDWTGRKQTFHRTTIHTGPNKQVFIVVEEAVLIQTLTLLPPIYCFLEEFFLEELCLEVWRCFFASHPRIHWSNGLT